MVKRKIVFDLGSRKRSSSPGIRALALTMDYACEVPRSGKNKPGEGLTTHAMPGSGDLCDRQLFEVVLLQRGQNTRFETLVVPNEHAYVCARRIYSVSAERGVDMKGGVNGTIQDVVDLARRRLQKEVGDGLDTIFCVHGKR